MALSEWLPRKYLASTTLPTRSNGTFWLRCLQRVMPCTVGLVGLSLHLAIRRLKVDIAGLVWVGLAFGYDWRMM